MVNIDIPLNYTASPSSFSGTPHLTINRDVTVDLDSTNAFEGMPITFAPRTIRLIFYQAQRSY